MSREIKFRGRRIDNGEWAYGYYVCLTGKNRTAHYILPDRTIDADIVTENSCFMGNFPTFEVDPATVGQFTGLLDKNGVEIYEGNICKIHFYHLPNRMPDIGSVMWSDKYTGFDLVSKNSTYSLSFKTGGAWGDKPAIEVIGSIHQNPELLEVSE